MLPNKQLHGFISVNGIATSHNSVPFWMRSQQYGSIPLSGASASVSGMILKNYHPAGQKKLLDWGAAAEGRLNAGTKIDAILVQSYVKVRLGIFQLKAGRSRDLTGLVDSTLSSGAFAVSGNSLGIPKIEISIPEYWSIPFTKELFSIKGNLSHGWLGNYSLRTASQIPYAVDTIKAYYHQKSFYARLGKPAWKTKIYGGFNHQVMWGNEKKIFPQGYELSNLETYKYVFLGKAYGNQIVLTSKIGNQLGTIDQAVEFNYNLNGHDIIVTGYHQFFYDIGGLYHLTNIKDGLWGLSLKNNKTERYKKFFLKKILFEFFNSKSQGGEADSKATPSGAEDYYNNYLYYKGWSYKGQNIGNALITSKNEIREDLPQNATEYFSNNRVVAIHSGSIWTYGQWDIKALMTYSWNYGTYSTSPVAKSVGGKIVYNKPPYFYQVNQFSGLLETSRLLKNGYSLGVIIAIDRGYLIDNSLGGSINISKTW
ncbi:capsule assembly Wzi family protein [Dyadobacter psychrotolerans]|nr:capsule assembly Wzi family protein [Dyadobacter psychrotolerans]